MLCSARVTKNGAHVLDWPDSEQRSDVIHGSGRTETVLPPSDHYWTETVAPSGDHYCIDKLVVPSSDH